MAKTNRLPPLTATRTFDSVARLGSFTRAAEELGTTQAAVSYQIKLLEERAGTPLLSRRPRQVTTTEVGAQFAAKVAEAFSLLEDGWAKTRGGAEGVLVISTIPTFGFGWLAQRVGAFQMEHPKLALRLETSTRFCDFASHDFDVEIRGGDGNWPGVRADLLFRAEFTPMLNPALLAPNGAIEAPIDLLRLPLIDAHDPWWRVWFDDMGVVWQVPADLPETRMRSQAYEAVSAIAGQGVALLTPRFYQKELANGTLVQPFDHLGWDGFGYWLVYPEGRLRLAKVRAFRKWLLEQTSGQNIT